MDNKGINNEWRIELLINGTDRFDGAEIQYTEDAADGGGAEGGWECRGCGCCEETMTLGGEWREGLKMGLEEMHGDGVMR